MADMTSTSEQIKAEGEKPVEPMELPDPNKERNKQLLKEIKDCKNHRSKLIPEWAKLIDRRRGKPFATASDEDRVAVPLDWSLTKAKAASLYSNNPQLHIDHHPESQQAGAWLSSYERKVNTELIKAGIESTMDESVIDTINASGFGVAMVYRDAVTVDKSVPKQDPNTLPPGVKPEFEVVPMVLDSRYGIDRISPADALWPLNFTGSDFNKAPWRGRDGKTTKLDAKRRWKLTDEELEKAAGDDKNVTEKLVHDIDKDRAVDDRVSFSEIFYWEHCYDPDFTSFSKIHHVIFVNGIDKPVVDEAWKGQKEEEDPNNPGQLQLLGSMKMPIQFLTLTYITDEAVPPSDCAMGVPMVDEINKGRGQMIQQRQLSLPMRWGDSNRLDSTILQGLMRGTWQAIIPVQGPGDKIIGEVSRATHPQENFTFDQVAKADLSEVWSLGPNQTGTGRGVETAAEADSIQSAFQSRVSRDRAKVVNFFIRLAEVLGGLISIYEEPTSFGEGFDPNVCKTLAYSVVADSTVAQDSRQRIQQLDDFVNIAAKSGYLEIEPILRERATLTGLDPNVVIKKPEPTPPDPPSISLRISGAEDMVNPLVLALLDAAGQMPTKESIEKSKLLIQLALSPPPGQPTAGGPPVGGPEGQPPMPGQPPMDQGQLPPGGPIDLTPQPPPVPAIGKANPEWSAMDRINKRTDHGDRG